MVRQEQLLPISTRACAACGELDRGIYLTENNIMLFLAIQIILQGGMSKEGGKNYPSWQWLVSDCLSVCITTARNTKENIYLCHPSKVKENKHQSSKFTPIFLSLLYPQAPKHFHFLGRETRKMTMLWACFQVGADLKLDCQKQRRTLSRGDNTIRQPKSPESLQVFASGASHAPCLPLRSRGCYKLKLKAKGSVGKQHDFCEQALTDPCLPNPPSLSQAHSSCLLAGAISASPAPLHEPNLLWPAQLLTITGAAARLELLGCGLRVSWLLGPCWGDQDPSLPSILPQDTKHSLTAFYRYRQNTKKSSGDAFHSITILFLNGIFQGYF